MTWSRTTMKIWIIVHLECFKDFRSLGKILMKYGLTTSGTLHILHHDTVFWRFDSNYFRRVTFRGLLWKGLVISSREKLMSMMFQLFMTWERRWEKRSSGFHSWEKLYFNEHAGFFIKISIYSFESGVIQSWSKSVWDSNFWHVLPSSQYLLISYIDL